MAGMIFTVDLKVASLNTIARQNRWVYKAAADEATIAAFAAITKFKLKPITEFPVRVHFHACWKLKKNRDIDALFCKSILDALKKKGIIPDDSLKYVSAALYTGEIGVGRDQLVVSIERDDGSWYSPPKVI